MAAVTLTFEVDAATGIAKIKQFGQASGKVTSTVATSWNKVKKAALAALGTYGALRTARFAETAVKEFAAYSKGLAEVGTLSTAAKARLGEFKTSILHLSRETGQPLDELTKGLYDSISASIPAAAAIKFLGAASKLAVAGVSSTAETVDLLTSAMNAYQVPASSAEKISDKLFATVKLGKTTITELAANIGKVAPATAAAGISMDEMLGAMAAMTKQGISTAESATGLRATIAAFAKPTKALTDAFASMGWQIGAAELKQMGLTETLRRLKTVSETTGKSMAELLPIEAFKAIAAMTTDVEDLAAGTRTVAAAAGSTNRAYGDMAGEIALKTDRMKAVFHSWMVIIGEKLSPDFARLIDSAIRAIPVFADLAIRIGGPLMKAFVAVTQAAAWLLEKFVDVGEGLGILAAKLVSEPIQALKELWSFWTPLLTRFVESGLKMGSALVGNIIEGIKSMSDASYSAVKDWLQGIRDYLPFSPAKKGPLSDLDKSGAAIPKTLAAGVRATAPNLTSAIEAMLNRTDKIQGDHLAKKLAAEKTSAEKISGIRSTAEKNTAEKIIDERRTMVKVLTSEEQAAAKRAAKIKLDIHKQFAEEYKRRTLSAFDYEVAKLDEMKKKYLANGEDKIRVSLWYLNAHAELVNRDKNNQINALNDVARAQQAVHEQFLNDYNRTVLSGYELEKLKLDELKRKYTANGEARNKIDRWYHDQLELLELKRQESEIGFNNERVNMDFSFTRSAIANASARVRGQINALVDLTTARMRQDDRLTDNELKNARRRAQARVFRAPPETFTTFGTAQSGYQIVADSLKPAFLRFRQRYANAVGNMKNFIQGQKDFAAFYQNTIDDLNKPARTTAASASLATQVTRPRKSTIAIHGGGVPATVNDFLRKPQFKPFASGGIVRNPTFAMMGEAGPEAIVPLPDGKSVPVQFTGQAQPASRREPVHVHLSLDGRELRQIILDWSLDGSLIVHSGAVKDFYA